MADLPHTPTADMLEAAEKAWDATAASYRTPLVQGGRIQAFANIWRAMVAALPPARAPMPQWLNTQRTSYWQIGCDDAKTGRPYCPPTAESEYEGYHNGFRYGARLPRGVPVTPKEAEHGL